MRLPTIEIGDSKIAYFRRKSSDARALGQATRLRFAPSGPADHCIPYHRAALKINCLIANLFAGLMLHHEVWCRNDREASCIGRGLLRRVSLPIRTIGGPLGAWRLALGAWRLALQRDGFAVNLAAAIR